MTNDTPLNLKWKLKLTVELAPGESVEHNVTEWKRGEPVDLASLGLSTEEGKTILAGIQTQMVTLQVERHGQAGRCCAKCGRRLRNKGHYRSTVSVRPSAGLLEAMAGRLPVPRSPGRGREAGQFLNAHLSQARQNGSQILASGNVQSPTGLHHR